MRHGALLGLVVGLLAATGAVRANELDDAAAERALLLGGRAEAEARYEGRVRNCEQRIFVNDCLNRARKERRQALEPIDDRIATLDEAERTRRAAERRAAIAAKQAAQAAEQATDAPELPARLPKSKRTVSLAQPPASAPAQPSPAERARDERLARERYERKQAEAAAHRAELQKRNADRSKPAAAPLPSASAP